VADLTAVQRFGPAIAEHVFRDYRTLLVPSNLLLDLLTWLKQEQHFNMLIDITAVDYLEYRDAEHRYGVIYLLLNLASGQRWAVKTFLDPPRLELPSVYNLWRGADWLEREVYDMFAPTCAVC
jgi:NADH-quinone oxidoreductase subunit C